MLKKLSLLCSIFVFTMLFSSSSYAQYAFEDKHEKFVDKNNYFSYEMTYPNFNVNANKNISFLNNAIVKATQKLVVQFKAQIASPAELQQMHQRIDIPLSENSNFIKINYKMFQNSSDIVSIGFDSNYSLYGAAHPNSDFYNLNYEISQKKVLQLNDIFSSSRSLEFLSTYSREALFKKLNTNQENLNEQNYIMQQIKEGTMPKAENFKYWNFSPEGLVLTFPPYQVAAYVYGTQQITIPYNKLQPFLKPQFMPKPNKNSVS